MTWRIFFKKPNLEKKVKLKKFYFIFHMHMMLDLDNKIARGLKSGDR